MTMLDAVLEYPTPVWWTHLPDVHSRCVQRFFVNYRLPLERARAILPPQLAPVAVDGVAVASACLLQLDRVVPGPLALPAGHWSRNCAHRIAVVHRDTGQVGVYVHHRNTDSRLVGWVTALGFPGRHRRLDLSFRRDDGAWEVRMADGEPLLHLRARPGEPASTLFPSTAAFSAFVGAGVRSWAPSVVPGRLVVVDLEKEACAPFVPLAVEALSDDLMTRWLGTPEALGFDSAFRTAGGAYTWHYIGIE